jgi:hypothetical protein
MTKKTKILAMVGVLALGTGLLGYKPVSATAKVQEKATDLPSCQASCTTEGCFCNRSCILWYCWGDWYCQCEPS